VIPKEHHVDVGSLAHDDPGLLGEVLREAAAVAADVGGDDGAYRVVFNRGADAGQSVFHVHAHVLAGRLMGWPPG